MNSEEAKRICWEGKRVIARMPGKAARRIEKISSLVYRPDKETGKWKLLLLLYDYPENPDSSHLVEPEYVELDENQESEGLTKARAFMSELREREKARQLRLEEPEGETETEYKSLVR